MVNDNIRQSILDIAAKQAYNNDEFKAAFIRGAENACQQMSEKNPEFAEKYKEKFVKIITDFEAAISRQKHRH